MRRVGTWLLWVGGLLLSAHLWAADPTAPVSLPAPGSHAAGLTPGVITVIDPVRSKPLKPVEVSYRGYPAVVMLDLLLGQRWRAPGTLVGFETKDGYLSLVPSERLQKYPAYLVYERADGDAFSVEVPPLDHLVPLGPWYLVWNNVMNPDLRVDGATYWPYQVTGMKIMDAQSLQPLYPPMLPESYRRGARLTQQYCLSCHQVNRVGGSKMPIDLAQWATGQSFARFATWVLDPSGKDPLTTMPALAVDRPAAERQMMARQIYGYLRALGALGNPESRAGH